MVASWICFQLEIRFLGRWALVTLPDGSISSDNTRWMLMSAGLFLAVVCIGGFFLFRKMTRKEIFFSSSALVALNIVLGIFTYLTQRIFTSFAMLWSALSEWASVFSQIAFQFGLNEWLSAAIVWILPPIYFPLVWQERSSYRLMNGGPSNDNPNYIIQVGNVFGFIISIENVL